MIDRGKVIRHIVAEISIAKTCKKNFASVDIDMLSDALELLKEQEAVEPIIGSYGNKRCGVCRNKLQSIADKDIFCCKCGRKVKWDDNN